jgi:twitching motility two-component system response regulator PilH
MARVLIVDDSPTEMYKLTGMLEKHGHQVLKAENGADGVALARQEKPDAVLMDIVMPGLNGFQATRQLSKEPETNGIPNRPSLEDSMITGIDLNAGLFFTRAQV